MFNLVEVPVWLLVVIIGLSALAALDRILAPSVRWFFRRRMERAVARLNARLERPIEVFKLARRQDMVLRLAYDPQVMQAVADHAAEQGIPPAVAFEQARGYAREIVPAFSATLYFGFAVQAARWISQALFRIRIGKIDAALNDIDRNATVVFVINHRSNMDYVLVTWLVSGRAAISYAVGEWARIWPLSRLFRAMGAYFIRRKSRNALYRKVLARYVQMAAAEGVTQALFPEGGLSLDGRVGAAKVGLLSYLMATDLPLGRDLVFVPVGLSYDRVIEDRVLTEAAASNERRFRARPLAILAFILRHGWRLMRGQFDGFGTAAAAFGAPISLTAMRAAGGGSAAELAENLMQAITRAVPVLPVPLIAAALQSRPATRADLAARVAELTAELRAKGAMLTLAATPDATLEEGLRPLIRRKLVTADLTLHPDTPDAAVLLEFYANPVLQHLSPPSDAAAQRT